MKLIGSLTARGAAVGAATALVCASALVAGPAPAAEAATGQTPGTYATWSAPADVTSFSMPMTLQVDPGDYNAYWSTQFAFSGSQASGYFGFQTHEDGGGMFLVSVWNGSAATPGGSGTYCQNFAEDGTGKTCRLDTRPVKGHAYALSAQQSGSNWTFSINDRTAGTTITLGTISIDGTHPMAKDGFDSWTEYFDWNDPSTVCADARYSRLLFGIPTTSAGNGTYTGSSLSDTCQDIAKVTLSGAGALQENGIGQ
ncbi:DUF3472 domain-containing protein [Streptomyces sp. NPDC059740]|uniref:DUF3472 domain-containing protein n=1 Tax=Streptomyces sp. NPDC059740 TaxID=3346926 RepID=UPI00366745E2